MAAWFYECTAGIFSVGHSCITLRAARLFHAGDPQRNIEIHLRFLPKIQKRKPDEGLLGTGLPGDPWHASASSANGRPVHAAHASTTGDHQIVARTSQSNEQVCKCLTSHYNELENFYAAFLKYYGTGRMD